MATKINSVNARNYEQFVFATQFDTKQPGTYTRAIQGPNTTKWAKAMAEELDQLHKNKTWTLIPASEMKPGHQALDRKWVYKIKRDVNSNIACFKAKWVVKGYLQQFEVDFDLTFTSVVKPIAFKVWFAVAAFFDLDIDQMDVKTAFLYGFIDQLVYVDIPKGSETETNQGMVCKLLKALYGLKQSPRLWYERLSDLNSDWRGSKPIKASSSLQPASTVLL